MGSRKVSSKQKKKKAARSKSFAEAEKRTSPEATGKKKLECILKCDTSGCIEAITSSILSLDLPELDINIIRSGVGAINKSDVFMAETGSRLILGFNVGFMPHIDAMAGERNVEIRIYDVIYRLIEDVETIGRSLIGHDFEEKIIGSAKVIALFKSSRKGIIIGCEVLKGKLALGNQFRVLGALGVVYVGTIKSLHIENDAVREAGKGQQAGLKISDFNKVRIGDLVESFQLSAKPQGRPWEPSGSIFYP